MEIKLQTERIVEVEAFNMSRTYSGLLVGEPNKVINDKIISDYESSLILGNRKSVFIVKDKDYIADEVLKPVIYSAWLDSEPINDKENQYDGSWIVVSWFGEEQIEKSIKDIIVEGISDFDWDKNAENIQF